MTRRMDGSGGGRDVGDCSGVVVLVVVTVRGSTVRLSLAVLAVLRGTGSTLGGAFLVVFVADSKAAELAIAIRQASR